MIKLQVGIENRMGSGKKGFCIKKGGKGVRPSILHFYLVQVGDTRGVGTPGELLTN